MTTLDATPQKVVLTYFGSTNPMDIILDKKFIDEAGRIAAEHCKIFDKVASLLDALIQPDPPSFVLTYDCE